MVSDGESALPGRRLAVRAVIVCLAMLFAGSTLVTPLYPQYQQLFGFSELTLTLIYAAYVLGNLTALLFFGRASDSQGRRPVILAAIGVCVLSTLVFLFACSPTWLAVGRMLSGAGIGLSSGTAAAWLADLQGPQTRVSAAAMAVTGNMVGLAAGALLGGLLSQYAPWPLELPYVIYLALLLALAFMMRFPTETVVRASRRMSLRPRIAVPTGLRAQFFATAATLFSSMALFGFYAALAPTILKSELHQGSRAVSGAVVFELSIVAALVVFFTRRAADHKAMLWGLSMLLPSVALLVLAQSARSLGLLLLGTTLAGVAVALGYRGSLQVVNRIAPPERRAEVVSAYLLCGFAGNSLPIIGFGILSNSMSALGATTWFAGMLAALAFAALVIAKFTHFDPGGAHHGRTV